MWKYNVVMFELRLFILSSLSTGKGLGRAENGISEAIKVKVKCDKGGVSDVRAFLRICSLPAQSYCPESNVAFLH